MNTAIHKAIGIARPENIGETKYLFEVVVKRFSFFLGPIGWFSGRFRAKSGCLFAVCRCFCVRIESMPGTEPVVGSEGRVSIVLFELERVMFQSVTGADES